jgi:diacylglycerol O-acyltransferase / wax synthase
MKHLSGLDNLFLAMDHGNQLMQVAALGLYDPSTAPGGELRFKTVLKFFENRMKQTSVFRRRLVDAPWGLDRPHWIEESDVDIEYHVRHIALPQPGDWRQLMIQVARLHSRLLDKTKPLWEAYIIEGLDNIPGIVPGSFALYIKFHHAAVDGAGGAEILRAIHSLSPEPDPEAEESSGHQVVIADREPTTIELCARAVSHRARQLFDGSLLVAGLGKRAALAGVDLVTSGKLLDAGRKVLNGDVGVAELAAGIVKSQRGDLRLPPHTRFDGRISAHRVVDAVSYSLADCAKIREHVAGVTINDIFLAAAGGALRKYLDLKGELPSGSLNAMMPLSTRDEHTARDANNQVGLAVVSLGSDIADPLERLHAVHRGASRGKSVANALGREFPARLIDALPAMVVEQIASSVLVPMVNATVSNVRGPDAPLYLAGAKLQMFTPISIIIDGIGLNITGLSYNGQLWVCFVSCRKMLPDPGVFGKCLTESFAELIAAALATGRTGDKAAVVAPVRRKAVAKAPAVKNAVVKKAVAKKPLATKPVAEKPAVRKARAAQPAIADAAAVELPESPAPSDTAQK